MKNEPSATIEKPVTQKSSPSQPSADAVLSVDLARSLKAFQAARQGKRLKKDFEQLNRWFEIALNNMGRGLSMFDAQQHLIVCNKRYREIFGLPESLTQPGTRFADIVRFHVKMETGRDGPEEHESQRNWINQHVSEMERGQSFSSTRQLKDGRTILVSNQPLPDGGWVDLQEDVTEKREAETKISWLAHHDPLTELPNRFHFREQLQETFNEVAAGGGFALHWIDLDRFKEVNDTLGHPAGDALLKSVAKRLREVLRERDVVARLGGDEFAIIQRGVTSDAQAGHLANRIIATVSQPHHILGHAVSVGASVGVALAPRDGMDADQIVKNADVALYKAKTKRGSYHAFDAGEVPELGGRRDLESDLRVALSNGELELYYQPIVDVKTQEVNGFEALMRWIHPELGLILPDDFIPLAEETGLITEMGTWALNEACQQAVRWSKDVKVTVNLSPRQFEGGDLDQVVADALARSGLPARRLELEITEGLLLRDDFSTHEMLHKLRALGVSIALDDFGTAYASLSYLRSFPFDKIKIDRTFIRDLDHPEQNECVAIINAVTGLARQLKMTTVAEGVETLDHVNTAVVTGCDEVQGYYYSKPVRAGDVEALLARTSPQKSSAA